MNTAPYPAPAFYPLSQLLGLFPWACLHRFETVGQTNRKGNQSLGIPATLMPISLHHRDSQRGEEHLCWLGMVLNQRQPQGGRLCTLFFGKRWPMTRAPSEWFLVQASRREGERAFHSAGALIAPCQSQFGNCSKSVRSGHQHCNGSLTQ